MTTRADLEAQLNRDPRDVQSFLVYADFLLEQGLPQGELIRLQHALTPDSSPTEHVREHELRNELMPALKAHDASWHLGFPRTLQLSWIRGESLPELQTALTSPLCRFLESVTLSDYVTADALVDLLVRLPHLHEVALRSDLEMHDRRDALKLLADLGRLEKLRHLSLHVRFPRSSSVRYPAFPASRSSRWSALTSTRTTPTCCASPERACPRAACSSSCSAESLSASRATCARPGRSSPSRSTGPASSSWSPSTTRAPGS